MVGDVGDVGDFEDVGDFGDVAVSRAAGWPDIGDTESINPSRSS
ncbi:hypothetical protein [Micromonospora sp. NPDC005206]